MDPNCCFIPFAATIVIGLRLSILIDPYYLRDLEVCQGYGSVVDVYIPNRKSKTEKRFAFVRFIKVDNVDRLVGNLCTLWIGRMHLHANVVRFERPPIHSSRPFNTTRPAVNGVSSFASVLKGNPNNFNHISSSPAMVLDDECVVKRDLDNFVMGEVKDFSSINNLRVLLLNEGFQQVKLAYLGGLWVMIELASVKTKMRFMKHVGIASWFSQLCNAQLDFVSRERIVWIDIEGVPLHAWSRPTFTKIGSRWGEVLELEDSKEDCFARKRICIKTKQEDNILEKFKIIVRGKIFVLRAKELFVWSPTFKDNKDVEYCSEDDSVKGVEENNVDTSKQVNMDDESDVEGVSETYFGDQVDSSGHEQAQNLSSNEKEISSDPFNLYDLLNKRGKGEANSGLDSSIPFPPGFTPEREYSHKDAQEAQGTKNSMSQCRSEGLSSRVLEDAQPLNEHVSPGVGHKYKKGGSILEVLDDMIKVGQTMRFAMEGCMNDMERIIGSQGVHEETKLDRISDMDVKVLWGNYKFEHIIREAVGNSDGILCAWDPSIFRKDLSLANVLYGAIFRLLSVVEMVMGDFNKVRCMEDRLGSVFNVQSANEFNSFISNSGLVKIQLEGYSFTWSHQSAKKMSKLDRFLVTDGLLSLFPHLSGICLDRHLSDHRPILLREVVTDYGPYPFRWAIEGDENSKFFHGIINRKRENLASKGVMVDGEWVDDPCRVKKEFRLHFANRFRVPAANRCKLNYTFPNRLNSDKVDVLESPISRDEVRNAVWGYGENKSPGPDGCTFEFFRKF
ncbi:RNA-directed DNA polymerase, eukaryota [Tanacetum coccineum]|uniref:RNA-directed DNA polymerase, eukaryota n=1 Tax=Tanacetum coccineum TaxID=301880 RepID=A0ABQ5F4V7_9ASTR